MSCIVQSLGLINRFGKHLLMRMIRSVFVVLSVCCLASACASAPISLVGSNFTEQDSQSAPEQLSLQSASSSLEEEYERQGWSRAVSVVNSARRWVGHLAGRSSDEEEQAAPITLYLAENDLLEADASDAVQHLASDITAASDLAAQVETAAVSLLTSGNAYSRSSLGRDLNYVESSISHTRRALELFDAAIEQVEFRLSAEQLQHVRGRRDVLAVRSERLRDRADDISSLRRRGIIRQSLS